MLKEFQKSKQTTYPTDNDSSHKNYVLTLDTMSFHLILKYPFLSVLKDFKSSRISRFWA